jgi:3D (Asp-Asp-Asp) domain-containing protein
MRRNASAVIVPAFAVLLVLVMLSAVGKAEEKPTAAPADELLHDVAPSPKPRVMIMEVTAYCPCRKCCGKKARGLTASGFKVTHNAGLFVAADTALLPFQTRLLIPGYAGEKPVPVLDRGGAIKGNRIDVFFASHKEALQWGRRTIEVQVVSLAPASTMHPPLSETSRSSRQAD